VRKQYGTFVGLDDIDVTIRTGHRLPSQLSGGQRQSRALARALAVERRVLLLDEPFGALDSNVRKELRAWLRRLHDEVHVTTVLVTHDQEEALEVADEIVVINDGRIEQIGGPDELYDVPANPFVMEFLGPVTHFRGELVRPHDIDIFASPARPPARPPAKRLPDVSLRRSVSGSRSGCESSSRRGRRRPQRLRTRQSQSPGRTSRT